MTPPRLIGYQLLNHRPPLKDNPMFPELIYQITEIYTWISSDPRLRHHPEGILSILIFLN